MNGTLRLLKGSDPMARVALAGLCAGLLFAATGAFDTERVPSGPRLTYWLGLAFAGLVALSRLDGALARLAPRVAPIARRIAGWAILVFPMNSLAVLTCKWLFGGAPSLAGFALLLPGSAAVLATLQAMLVIVAGQASLPLPAIEVLPVARPPSNASHRLPLPKAQANARILALEAQDHYVLVHSDQGRALLRMRLSDAIALVDTPGFTPHRSWWVARGSIASVERRRGRRHLRVGDRLLVPVSRSGAARLQDSGLEDR